ncbi:hypothetical protein V7S43_009120 [Phytophthora oleae]|uniref:Uncharacterized protein n=1 Tax=Phytophthora oleae TaxID=2107226 RepID=A0ABD3FFG0_9STRA
MAHSAAKLQRMRREVATNLRALRQFEHRGPGREFCAANLYPENEDESQKEGTHRANTKNRKQRKTSNSDVLASLAESMAQMVDNDADEAQQETWTEQALLLRDQRLAHRLDMLTNMLERTKNEEQLLENSREEESKTNFDEEEWEAVLQHTINRRLALQRQISELEFQVTYGTDE